MDTNTTILLVAVVGIGFFLITRNQPGSFQQGPQGPVQAGPGPASGTISDIEQGLNAFIRTFENGVAAYDRTRRTIEGRT